MKRILLLIATIILLLPSVGCYAHGPWRGKVIEADTKKPIEGAVVVGVWYSETTLNPAGSSRTPMKVVETVTNADGEFYFSSKYFLDMPVLREVSGPNFLIYKPGYGASGDYSEVPYRLNKRPLYKNELAIFELPRLENKKGREKAWDSADEFRSSVGAQTPNENKTPLLRNFINQERKYLGFTGEEG